MSLHCAMSFSTKRGHVVCAGVRECAYVGCACVFVCVCARLQQWDDDDDEDNYTHAYCFKLGGKTRITSLKKKIL